MSLDNLTTPELLLRQEQVTNNPASRSVDGGLFLYTKKAQRRLDEIAMQITRNIALKRAAEGRPVVCDGYSGRKQNRRR